MELLSSGDTSELGIFIPLAQLESRPEVKAKMLDKLGELGIEYFEVEPEIEPTTELLVELEFIPEDNEPPVEYVFNDLPELDSLVLDPVVRDIDFTNVVIPMSEGYSEKTELFRMTPKRRASLVGAA